jgi:hypothetical protein
MSKHKKKQPGGVITAESDHSAVRESFALQIGRQRDLEAYEVAADVSEPLCTVTHVFCTGVRRGGHIDRCSKPLHDCLGVCLMGVARTPACLRPRVTYLESQKNCFPPLISGGVESLIIGHCLAPWHFASRGDSAGQPSTS